MPPAGFVLLHGADLDEAALLCDGPDLGSVPRLCVRALPLCATLVDEATVVSGHALLALRQLVSALARGQSMGDALDELGGADGPEATDLSLLDGGRHLVDLSFPHEFALCKAILWAALEAVPSGSECSHEAARLLELLAPFRSLPPEWVPTQSYVRQFCGAGGPAA